MEWSKVKWNRVEQVPVPDHEVLAVNVYGQMMVGQIFYDDVCDTEFVCIHWRNCMYDVTHWAEPPEPPWDELREINRILRGR